MNTDAETRIPETVNILGVGVHALDMAATIRIIRSWISDDSQNYICVTNVHAVMECYRSSRINRIYREAGLVTPDGMPLVWLSRIAGFKNTQRIYGPDLLIEFLNATKQCGFKHFFYGGEEGIVDKLAQSLCNKFPGLNIAGCYSPPFRKLTEEEDLKITELINKSEADIVWVGLGAPKQEIWMADHLGKIQAPVMIGIGAAFDFLSGSKPQAPRWIRSVGLEWFFRLLTEPCRLWKRYLVYNSHFVLLSLLQLLGLKKFE